MASGMVPSSWLPPRYLRRRWVSGSPCSAASPASPAQTAINQRGAYRYCSWFRAPIASGMVPVSWLMPRYLRRRWVAGSLCGTANPAVKPKHDHSTASKGGHTGIQGLSGWRWPPGWSLSAGCSPGSCAGGGCPAASAKQHTWKASPNTTKAQQANQRGAHMFISFVRL